MRRLVPTMDETIDDARIQRVSTSKPPRQISTVGVRGTEQQGLRSGVIVAQSWRQHYERQITVITERPYLILGNSLSHCLSPDRLE